MLESALFTAGEYIPFELKTHINIYWTNDYVQRLLNVRDWTWSDAMGNTFHFTNRNQGKESGTRVWRSDAPFDATSLPAEPHLVLEPGATSFTDPDAPRGSRYWYMLEVFKGAGIGEFTAPFDAYALGINVGPGPQELIAGTPGAGFYGEVPVSEFITGNALASAIGLTAGIAQYSNEPWLKFNLDGKTLFVSKRPYRHTISWNQINAVGAVYGTRTVTIKGETYKVRLLKGAASDPMVGSTGYDPESSWGSEWNRLMYHISGRPFSNASTTLASEGITEGDWAQYSEADLVIHFDAGNGRYSWCQETDASNASRRVYRGYHGVSSLYPNPASDAGPSSGWRPCLELVD